MKWILIGILLCSGTEIFAKENRLLQCLAKEEEKLHKLPNQNSEYKLNQEFINELASSNDISLKKEFIDEICLSKKIPPSVGLLRLLLLKESAIYDLNLTDVEPSLRPFKMGYINEFQKQVPRMFLQYLANKESELPASGCLGKKIPEIKYFSERLKYLEEEINTHQIISDKKKIEMVFSKLQNFSSIKKECIAEFNRNKKKTQSIK